MPSDDDKSLGDDATMQDGKPTPADERSLGDRSTFGGSEGSSLSDLGEFADLPDHDMEIVDLSGRYKIEETLGQGGMGEVFLATDTRLNRKVAIKRIRNDAGTSKAAVARFLTEAKSVAALNHPNVVQIHDYGRDESGPFLIMEYVAGGSLLDRCKQGPMELEESVELTCQLCDGLGRAHDAGIIHRDIKPANILMTTDGLPKLTDFGLAKAATRDHTMTATGGVLGTLDFMPPEQRQDLSLVDARSDLWSLAATLYQMVTGKSPRVIRLHEAPHSLRIILGKALEEAKQDRYQSAFELATALQKSEGGQPTSPKHLDEGQCASCGASNRSSRKYCKECAAPLLVACFGCESPMPVWEKVCGECGCVQEKFLAQQRDALTARRSKAEEYLQNLNFSLAKKTATQIAAEKDVRLGQWKVWSDEFFKKVNDIQTAELGKASRRLIEAVKHEDAKDYLSGIRALEQIPRAFHRELMPGHTETVADMLKRLLAIQQRIKDLEDYVEEQIENGKLSGLLDEVDRLLELAPHRDDFITLKNNLKLRNAKLVAEKTQHLTDAREAFEAKDYENCLFCLTKIDRTLVDDEVIKLRQKSEYSKTRLIELNERIKQCLAAKQFDKSLEMVSSYLALKPNDMEHLQLREELIGLIKERDEQKCLAMKLASEARRQREQCQFAAAVKTLQQIPDVFWDKKTVLELDQNRLLDRLRSTAMDSLNSAQSSDLLSEALAASLPYRSLLNIHAEIQDPDFWDLCHEKQQSYDQQQEAKRKERVRRFRISGLCVTAVLILAGFLALRFVKHTEPETIVQTEPEAIVNAIGMELIPSNSEALAMQKAKILGLPPRTNSIGMELKLIPPGTFTMGGEVYDDETPHRVTLTKTFELGVYEVTQEQYEKVMGENPSFFKWADNPVEQVSWADALEFCRKLSALPAERSAGRTYRLPTEAEWEYACRAGGTTEYSFGDDVSKLDEYAWFGNNSGDYVLDAGQIWDTDQDNYGSRLIYNDCQSHPVGQKRPNAWGLYDMHGNVWEWCSDLYGDFPSGSATDPAGPASGSGRVYRGGSWYITAADCRSARRYGSFPSYRNNDFGFRVTCVPSVQ